MRGGRISFCGARSRRLSASDGRRCGKWPPPKLTCRRDSGSMNGPAVSTDGSAPTKRQPEIQRVRQRVGIGGDILPRRPSGQLGSPPSPADIDHAPTPGAGDHAMFLASTLSTNRFLWTARIWWRGHMGRYCSRLIRALTRRVKPNVRQPMAIIPNPKMARWLTCSSCELRT